MTEDNEPQVPDTVGELLGMPDAPEGFDPRSLPGAEVMFDDGDLSVVAVPIGSLPDGKGPADNVMTLGDFLGEDLGSDVGISDLLDSISLMSVQLEHMEWAREENAKVCERIGEVVPQDEDTKGGPVFEALPLAACLLQPYMAPERIFRAHAREIYERVARGEDVRPGTDAEVLGVLADWIMDVPFCGGLMALYFRMAERIVPEDYRVLLASYQEDHPDFDLSSFLAEAKEDADEHEADIRGQLTRDREPDKL